MDLSVLETIGTVAAFIAVATGGTVAGIAKWRANGRARVAQAGDPQPAQARPSQPQHVVQAYPQAPPDFDPAGDTGQFAIALERAPTETLLQMASDIKTIAGTRPATRADLDAVKGEINGKLDVHSDAIADLRSAVVGLPCQAPASTSAPCPAGKPTDVPVRQS
jgi:hypothetical protein